MFYLSRVSIYISPISCSCFIIIAHWLCFWKSSFSFHLHVMNVSVSLSLTLLSQFLLLVFISSYTCFTYLSTIFYVPSPFRSLSQITLFPSINILISAGVSATFSSHIRERDGGKRERDNDKLPLSEICPWYYLAVDSAWLLITPTQTPASFSIMLQLNFLNHARI